MKKKWRCTVCQYEPEGDEPPERCPVCAAPREKFDLVSEGPPANEPLAESQGEEAPRTLEEVRDRARDKMQSICAVYPQCDGTFDHLCNREAYGNRIGLGGAGTGASFAANVSSLARHRLRTRLVGPHFEPDTSIEFLGERLSLPVMGSSTAGFGGFDLTDDQAFNRGAVQGCLDAGTICWRGDTELYTLESHAALDALEAGGGRGVAIFKPRAQDDLKRLIARAVEAGCPAVGVDLDGCGSTNMARAGQPVYRKSVAELRELVDHASIPFVAKGIMDADDADLCAEAGVKVVAVSNHGGRVLDHTPGVAEVLPAIAQRLGGRLTITADGGVRTGYDVLKMLALGAHAVLIGRDLIRAVLGGGAPGVKLQMDRLRTVLARAMVMTSCPTIKDIDTSVLC